MFDKAALDDGHADLGLVFATGLGTPLGLESVSKRFKAALTRAGLDAITRVYDLRHGCAMLLREAGESVPTVAQYLGHASPAVTMAASAHAVPGATRRATERLGTILSSARKGPETASGTASEAG